MSAHRIAAILVMPLILNACTESTSTPTDLVPSFAAGGAPYLPAEQQPVVDLSRGTYAIFSPGEGQILAQTFTPQSNQWLGYIELPVGCEARALLNVKIRDGLGGTILSEGNTIVPVEIDGTFQLIQLFDARHSQGIRLRKNHEYVVELSAFSTTATAGMSCGIAAGPAGDSYANGGAYYQDPVNGPSFLPLPTGLVADQEDLPFRTLSR
jgi:hypothetical protein